MLISAVKVAGSGLQAQSARIRVVSQNLANAQSSGDTPGADPYRRKTVSFESELDRASNTVMVKAGRVQRDPSVFPLSHDPSHPAADAQGNVKMPNVNPLMELADMREANRAYEANLQVISMSKRMLSMTIDLLRSSR